MCRSTACRQTWDYIEHYAKFIDWIEKVSQISLMLNLPDVIRWNSHKRYLSEFAELGLNTVPTIVASKSSQFDLPSAFRTFGCDRLVVKPAVGAGALDQIVVQLQSPDDVLRAQSHLDELLTRVDVLIQPFLSSILTQGELSLMFFDGAFSHAVQKLPKSGDYRIQTTFGGTFEPIEPSRDVLEFATRVIRTASTCAAQHIAAGSAASWQGEFCYARVDVVYDAQGKLCLIELELIEPFLYFHGNKDAANRCADAILKHAVVKTK
eukprot:TRINITY_DN6865_c0_g1_i2.p1 TRINITY_DN6865_c0_g1~~TRINITY_DN6865_c0_g1_i2.p1  ORF type:complete len:265 (-),score=49.61 TRINITY_DN6865_c0_g1_i2:98-892(-)